MSTLRQVATDYVPQQTMIISDLETVPIDIELYDKEGIDSKGESYTFSYIELNEVKYRVPNSVKEQIQDIIKLRPDVKSIKVKKSGSGMGTRYKVELVN